MMRTYVGTKTLKAQPMSLGEYNSYRGWLIPESENPEAQGYLVEHQDGRNPNHPNHEGYISWSPVDVFEKAYHPKDNMTFSQALDQLKLGYVLSREGWNGKDMFIFLVQGSNFNVNRAPLSDIFPVGTPINYKAHIDIKTASGAIAVWNPSQEDMMAEDWGIPG